VELVRLVRERGGEGRLVDEGSNAIATFRQACQEIFNPAYFEPLHSRGRVGEIFRPGVRDIAMRSDLTLSVSLTKYAWMVALLIDAQADHNFSRKRRGCGEDEMLRRLSRPGLLM